jgi:Rrf2 family nitric oxide-sensitive transcriptional repressor
MRLSLHTDYALRALIYLAAMSEPATTAGAIAESYGISKNHLVKVLQRLRDLGLVETVRGRGGGVRLSTRAEDIRLGAVVRKTEDLGALVECFNLETNTCPLAPVCLLQRRLDEALRAYLDVLDRYTLADVTTNRGALARALRLPTAAV